MAIRVFLAGVQSVCLTRPFCWNIMDWSEMNWLKTYYETDVDKVFLWGHNLQWKKVRVRDVYIHLYIYIYRIIIAIILYDLCIAIISEQWSTKKLQFWAANCFIYDKMLSKSWPLSFTWQCLWMTWLWINLARPSIGQLPGYGFIQACKCHSVTSPTHNTSTQPRSETYSGWCMP